MERVRIRSSVAVLAALVMAGLSTMPAEAQTKTVTYDWWCEGDYCEFDASDSTQPVYKYYFDFGDGSSTGLSGSSFHSHDYNVSGSHEFDVRLVLFYASDPNSYEVTCTIDIYNPPIGGVPPHSGTCSN